MKSLLFVAFLCAVVSAMSLPGPGSVPVNAVPHSTIEQLALRKAAAEWPGAVLGPVLPYVDETGATVGYMFHFRTDGRPFPAYEDAADEVLALSKTLTANTDISKWRSPYAFLLVSARYDRAPIVCYGYGSSEYYAIGRAALSRAKQALGQDAHLSRIYFVNRRTFLEFASNAGKVAVYASHFEQAWYSREEFAQAMAEARGDLVAIDRAATAELHRRDWQEALKHDFTDLTEFYVPSVERAPFYDWSYGCTPTSGAIVLGYIDRTQNYGRLIDYLWQRYDMVEGENDWQIPYAQRECALAMYTDTTTGGTYSTYIANGLRNAANGNGNNYSFTVLDQTGSSGNDWAWSTITSEIGAGRAFIWSAYWESHSLGCFGYRTPEKDVFVHNTWWAPGTWWHYSGDDWSQVCSPRPAGGDARRAEFTSPMGDTFYNSTGRGEILQVGDTASVTWNNFSNPGTKIDLEISTNGGRGWSALAGNLPDNGLYRWYLNPSLTACDSVRLRLKQYQSSTLTSGDGTFGCFHITREPLAPKFIAPPNGQQIFNGPVILTVDSLYSGDSLDFRLIYGSDTLLRQKTTGWTVLVPNQLLTYGRAYKWTCRAHNQFGWGKLGTPWSFWVRFQTGVEEQPPAAQARALDFEPIVARKSGVVFQTGLVGSSALITVYDAAGNRVAELAASDNQRLIWNCTDARGRAVSAGMYFVQLSGARAETRKLVLVD